MFRRHHLAFAVVPIIVWFALARAAAAQFPSLPAVDGVNASAQTGVVAPRLNSRVPNTDNLVRDLWGFGIESEFDLPFGEDSWWEGTLGLGINYLNLNADLGAGRRLRGGLRDLPVLSLYVGRADGKVYGGLSLGVSELKDGRLHVTPRAGETDPGPIKVSASAITPAIALGYEAGPVFFEVGYVGRFFPSVAYDALPATGFPTDLGERLYAGGIMVRVGGTLSLKPEPKPTKETKVTCRDREVTVVHAKDQYALPTCTKDQLIVDFEKKPAPPATQPAPEKAADPTSSP